MKYLPFLLLLGTLMGTITFPAHAQAVCGEREEVLTKLFRSYSEKPSAIGMSNNGGIVEILTSPQGETWTIIVTMPNGVSCVIAAGENWETYKPIRGTGL